MNSEKDIDENSKSNERNQSPLPTLPITDPGKGGAKTEEDPRFNLHI